MSDVHHDGVRDIRDLLGIMAALRDPVTGCPWDLQQTFATIAPYTIEEAYEVADAIDRGDPADLKDELGDLLLQVVFHARIAEEEGTFAFPDVVEAVTRKMIRRHPHVFGKPMLSEQGEPITDWDAIKKQEKAGKEWTEAYLPGALEEAEKLLERAKERKGIKK